MRIPKYRRHKGSGKACIQFAPFFGGRVIYLRGKYGSAESREHYEQLRKQILEFLLGQKPAPAVERTTATVNDLLVAYIHWAQNYYGGRSKQFGHMKAVANLVFSTNGKDRIPEFGPVALKKAREKMIAAGWARTYINDQTHRLRRIFRWGVSQELVEPSQLEALRAVAGLRKGKTTARENAAVKPVAWPAVEALLPHLPPMHGRNLEPRFPAAPVP